MNITAGSSSCNCSTLLCPNLQWNQGQNGWGEACPLQKGGEEHRGTSHGWCTPQLHLGGEGISMCPPHCSQTMLLFLLNVLYFPSSKSLLSLCSPPQMLPLQNPLVSVSLLSTCNFYYIHRTLLPPVKWTNAFIHLFILQTFAKHSSVLLGSRHFERHWRW